MRGLLLAGLLLWAATAQANEIWDSLWQTADQRGEQLMKHGNAAAAASTYSDPRRKAYAELQAGNYPQAARDFAAFDDSDGNYNRGNALARAGRLPEAIKAYDAALARDPANQDARHNRDLVAKALQKQHPQSKPASGNGNSGDRNPSSDKDVGKQQGDTAQKPPSQAGKDQQDKAGQGKEENSSAGQKTSPGRQQPARANQPATAGQANGQPQPADNATQARRDAAAGLGKMPAGQDAMPAKAPANEQQLAQEQWLRRIPDDPGGLLRRKFMIEHMIRQQRERL